MTNGPISTMDVQARKTGQFGALHLIRNVEVGLPVLPQRGVCLYHANCFDGLAAAWVLSRFVETAGRITCAEGTVEPYWDVEFIATDYHEAPPMEKLKDAYVWILDFSYETSVMEEIIVAATQVTMLDHHERSARIVAELIDWLGVNPYVYLKKEPVIVYRPDQSGALMAWHEFFPYSATPRILEHISDRDLWEFQLSGTREVMEIMGTYPLDLKAWKELLDVNPFTIASQFLSLPHEVTATARRIHRSHIQWIIKNTLRWIDFEGYRVPLINAPKPFTSDALHELYSNPTHECPVPFAMGYYDLNGDQGRRFSLRSDKTEGIIVNELARRYPGGDGHPHAAGFTVPRNHDLAKI